MTRRLFDRLRKFVGLPSGSELAHALEQNHQLVVQAHGDWIALLATILERQNVIASEDFARLLNDYAMTTTIDRPAEGRVLAAWALKSQNTAREIQDIPLSN